MTTKHEARRLLAREREKKAVELRISGMSMRAIGEQLGIKPAAVSQALDRAMAPTLEEIRDKGDRLRGMEIERIDGLISAMWSMAMGGSTEHTETINKLIARKCKILGLDISNQPPKPETPADTGEHRVTFYIPDNGRIPGGGTPNAT